MTPHPAPWSAPPVYGGRSRLHLESIEEGELYPAILGMGPIRIGRTDPSDP